MGVGASPGQVFRERARSVSPSVSTGNGSLQCLLAQTHWGTAILPLGLALCQPWAGGGCPTCPALLTQGLWPRGWFACLASLSWAKPVPLGSGTVVKGLWSSGYVGSVMYTIPCTARLCFHSKAGERGCPRPGNHPADGCHHALSIHWCFSLSPLPFTAQKGLQQIDMRAAGVSSAQELKCAMELGPSVKVLYTTAWSSGPGWAELHTALHMSAELIFQSLSGSFQETLQSWCQLTWISIRLSESSSIPLLSVCWRWCLLSVLPNSHKAGPKILEVNWKQELILPWHCLVEQEWQLMANDLRPLHGKNALACPSLLIMEFLVHFSIAQWRQYREPEKMVYRRCDLWAKNDGRLVTSFNLHMYHGVEKAWVCCFCGHASHCNLSPIISRLQLLLQVWKAVLSSWD